MVTLEMAKAKWARKMAVAGERWKSGVTGKGAEYCSGVAAFLGVGTCAPDKRAAFEAGVNAVSASDFQSAVAGKEEKWARKLREALAG